MARKILHIWQEYRPELDRVLNVTEWGANTTAASLSLGLGMTLGLVSPALGVPAASLALASPIKQAIAFIAEKKGKKHTLEEIVALLSGIREWLKLLISLATPVIIAGGAWITNNYLKNLDEKVLEILQKRLKIPREQVEALIL